MTLFFLDEGREKANQWAGIFAFYLAFVVALSPVLVRLRKQASPLSQGRPNRSGNHASGLAAEERDILTDAVARELRREEKQRGLLDPRLPLLWTVMGPPLSDHWRVIRHDGDDQPLVLEGDSNDLLVLLRDLIPSHRLAVLGEPGAGKTSLLIKLTLAALADRELDAEAAASSSPFPDRRVPVLCRLSTWDPFTQSVTQWLSDCIRRDYGVALKPSPEDVFPIMDGLDEMPEESRVVAVKAINVTFGDAPLVLTCRTKEYRDTIARQNADVITGAVVISLNPLSSETICGYLTDATKPSRVNQWAKVFSRIKRYPRGRLATSLSTPLALNLARATYAEGGRDPSILLTFRSKSDLEMHLLDQLLLSCYPDPPVLEGNPKHYRHTDARRWLAFIARSSLRRKTHDIAWWELWIVVPRPIRGLTTALLFGLAAGILGLMMALPSQELWILFSLGASGGMISGLKDQPARPSAAPARNALSFGSPAEGIGRRIISSVRRELGRRFIPVFAGTFTLSGLTSIIFISLEDPVSDMIYAALAAAILGLGLGVSIWFPLSIFLGVLLALFGKPRNTYVHYVIDPVSLYRKERRTILSAGAAFMIVSSLTWVLAGLTLTQTLFLAIVPTILLLYTSALGEHLMARLLLVLAGKLPLSLMEFLEDANRRGVLRQVGGVYQFRHALVRDRLARRDESGTSREASHSA
ncbi:hypothetical protein [Nonomuraea sp. NPDC048826]|uniref:hypothetical protein n=1 Tax=Nonomuraea sp. NPDC048826 TaxID=3364347 RepID=UPI00371CD985